MKTNKINVVLSLNKTTVGNFENGDDSNPGQILISNPNGGICVIKTTNTQYTNCNCTAQTAKTFK